MKGKRVAVTGGAGFIGSNLAKTIINIMGKDLKPVYEPPLPGDIRHSLADVSKARKIGYTPKYDLEAGLKQTIESVKSF